MPMVKISAKVKEDLDKLKHSGQHTSFDSLLRELVSDHTKQVELLERDKEKETNKEIEPTETTE